MLKPTFNMEIKMKVTTLIKSAAITLSIVGSSISTASAFDLKQNNLLNEIQPIQLSDSASFLVAGTHWVSPYFRKDGTFVRGHLRTNPDGFCWNNFSGC